MKAINLEQKVVEISKVNRILELETSENEEKDNIEAKKLKLEQEKEILKQKRQEFEEEKEKFNQEKQEFNGK